MLSNSESSDTNKPISTAIVQDGVKRITTTFPNGSELIQEWCCKTQDCLVKKRRRKNALGAFTSWEYEIGEPMENTSSDIRESILNPILYRKDTKTHFCWRVRNAIWPKDVYKLSIEGGTQIILKTTNKKYFTRIQVQDMALLGLPLQESQLAYDWGSNVLVILYQKPSQILDKEAQERKEILSVKESKDGDVDCKQS